MKVTNSSFKGFIMHVVAWHRYLTEIFSCSFSYSWYILSVPEQYFLIYRYLNNYNSDDVKL